MVRLLAVALAFVLAGCVHMKVDIDSCPQDHRGVRHASGFSSCIPDGWSHRTISTGSLEMASPRKADNGSVGMILHVGHLGSSNQSIAAFKDNLAAQISGLIFDARVDWEDASWAGHPAIRTLVTGNSTRDDSLMQVRMTSTIVDDKAYTLTSTVRGPPDLFEDVEAEFLRLSAFSTR